MRLRSELLATDGAARRTFVPTAKGGFHTPLFMPVGTRGSIRAATTAQLEDLGAEFMLGNTYHLMLRPGAETVASLGGLGRFSGWDGHLLTDSGGFQVFSLSPKVTDEGVTFRSVYDGDTVACTPESIVATQELLGGDIQMVLDVCLPLPADRAQLARAVKRTAAWAERARGAHTRRGDQALFGIVQGGTEADLRRESAQRTVALDFDGYAVGGLSVGEARGPMMEALEAAIAELPTDQPRYLMGVGDPRSMVEAVARGVDMFDCVLPTRLGRHGTLLTARGRINAKRAEFARSEAPLDPTCGCQVCARYSAGYVRHLLVVGEPAGKTLCVLHNLAWMLGFVDRMRSAIEAGSLDGLRAEVADVWP
ncbi:MAG: tRNA guanosine(34) transglycosylase Tgt [Microthrixaceae bacterium]